MKKLFVVFLIICLTFTFVGCQAGFVTPDSSVPNPTATITLQYTNTDNVVKEFSIVYALRYDKAPITVSNFAKLANEGFYNKAIVDSVVGRGSDFSVLSYLLMGRYSYDKTAEAYTETEKNYSIIGEFEANKWLDKDEKSINDLSSVLGSLVMYRDPGDSKMNSASTAFYISLSNNNKNEKNYAIFGEVTGAYGMQGETPFASAANPSKTIPSWFVEDMFGTSTATGKIADSTNTINVPSNRISVTVTVTGGDKLPKSYPTLSK